MNIPSLVCFAEWAGFILYWSAAAKNSSPAKVSESRKSRRVHELLLNAAFILVILPVPGLRQRLLPDASFFAWAGLVLQTGSFVPGVWARRVLGRHWSGEITIKVDHQLIRSGPYRWVRHPIYTAWLGMFAGTALVSGQMHAALGLGMAVFAYWRKIRLEEANLKNAFGPEYDAYRRETWALVPRVRLTRLLSILMFGAAFVLLGATYRALPPEMPLLRIWMGHSTLWAPKSPVTVFRVPLINLSHGLIAAVMLSRSATFENPQRRIACSNMFSTLLFAVAFKSDFEAMEIGVPALPFLGPYASWLGLGTVMSVVLGISLALVRGRKVPLPWPELRLSTRNKTLLAALFIAYLAFAILPVLGSHRTG